jgi:hypothetical protein
MITSEKKKANRKSKGPFGATRINQAQKELI